MKHVDLLWKAWSYYLVDSLHLELLFLQISQHECFFQTYLIDLLLDCNTQVEILMYVRVGIRYLSLIDCKFKAFQELLGKVEEIPYKF